MRWVLRGAGLFASAGVAGGALAQSPLPTLVYTAPAACPPEAEFTGRLQARLEASRTGARALRTLEVQITQADGRYVGRLLVIESDGRSSGKRLGGRNCDELVEALSLIAALAVESDEVTSAGDRAAASPPAASASADPGRAQAGAAPPPPRPTPPPATSSDEKRAASPGQERHTSRFAVELGGLAAAGPAPTVLFGGGLGLDWALLGPGPWGGLAFGIGAVAAAAPIALETGGRASFGWYAARLDACLVRLALPSALVLRGCLLGDVGIVNARGSDTTDPRSSSRGWLSLGALSRLDLPLSPRFGILVLAGVEAPLRRDRYAFGSVDFYAVPVVTATGSLAAAAYLP